MIFSLLYTQKKKKKFIDLRSKIRHVKKLLGREPNRNFLEKMEKEKRGADLRGIDFGEALDDGEDSFDDLVFGEMIVTVR